MHSRSGFPSDASVNAFMQALYDNRDTPHRDTPACIRIPVHVCPSHTSLYIQSERVVRDYRSSLLEGMNAQLVYAHFLLMPYGNSLREFL